jgi:hypothetical protein
LVIFLLSIVWKSVKIPVCLPAGKRKPPVGAGYSGEPHVFVSADTHQKALLLNGRLGAKQKFLRGTTNEPFNHS